MFDRGEEHRIGSIVGRVVHQADELFMLGLGLRELAVDDLEGLDGHVDLP